jgi:hypothetical protein
LDLRGEDAKNLGWGDKRTRRRKIDLALSQKAEDTVVPALVSIWMECQMEFRRSGERREKQVENDHQDGRPTEWVSEEAPGYSQQLHHWSDCSRRFAKR